MLSLDHIHPLTDFLRNHQEHIDRLRETRSPEVLTIDGKAALVVLDAESFQEIMDKIDRAELIEAIKEGLASANRGELKPAEQVFAEMKAKYGLQG
jgi:PHD/YefM family antitoxin component YafN of YafNO toxin-antitoxin module